MNDWKMIGKNILITGASGHLGRVLAEKFAYAGCRVFLQGRNREKLLDIQKNITGDSVVFAGDILEPGFITELFAKIEKDYDSLDSLINNAGLQTLSSIETMDDDEWDRMILLNLKGPHLTTRAFLALQKNNRSEAPSIINIASIEGTIPAPAHSHYGTSKGGLIQYTRASALELGAYGIRVNSVSPGLIKHRSLEKDWPDGVARYIKSSPLSRLVEPSEVADTVLFLASPFSRGITGVDLRVDTGMGVVQGY